MGAKGREERFDPVPEIDPHVARERSEEVGSALSDEATRVEASFRSIFENRYGAIHLYVLRRLGSSNQDALDVTAQVFALAWKRFDQVPEPPNDLPWLYAVARKIVSRHRRTEQRRQRLHDRLTSEALVSGQPSHPTDTEGVRVRAAMDRLRAKDQEVLRLVLWEQLSHAHAGEVLGCSANAVAIRLHKARQRLRVELTLEPAPGGADPAVTDVAFPEGH